MNNVPIKLSEIKLLGFRSFVKKALTMGVSVHKYTNVTNLFRLTYQDKTVYVNNGFIPLNARLGKFTIDKEVTKIILDESNVPVPHGFSITTQEEAFDMLDNSSISFPLIIKPLDGSQAKGVTWDITTKPQLTEAIQHIKKEQQESKLLKSKKFLMEEMVIGEEYRVLVLKGKVISCIKKLPATIIGDGSSSVTELVKKQNETRLADFGVKLDDVAIETLSKNGYTVDSILPNTQKLILRHDMMIGNGGRAIDCTHLINNQVQKDCVKAIKVLGLEYAGLDLISQDITKSNRFKVLEVNTKPAHILNEKPIVEGEGVDVSLLLLQEVFPSLKK